MSGRARSKSKYWVESLALGLDVLRAFGSAEASLSIVELARILKRNRTACYRFVHTLTELGYLERDEKTRRYQLGVEVLQLGFSCLNQLPLANLGQPYLDRLRERTGASANIGVLDHEHVTFIARAPGESASAITIHVGSRLPAISTSIGRAILAYQQDDKLEAVLSKAKPIKHTRHTLVKKKDLKTYLAKVRSQGYSYVDQEFEIGIGSVGAPIFNQRKEAVAGVNVVWNASSVKPSVVSSLFIPAVLQTAKELSGLLGQQSQRNGKP